MVITTTKWYVSEIIVSKLIYFCVFTIPCSNLIFYNFLYLLSFFVFFYFLILFIFTQVQPPKKGGDQAYHAVCGGTIASAVINTLFGFQPSPTDTFPILKDSTVPRGFDGVLKNVRHGKSLYTIISSSKGLTIEKQ